MFLSISSWLTPYIKEKNELARPDRWLHEKDFYLNTTAIVSGLFSTWMDCTCYHKFAWLCSNHCTVYVHQSPSLQAAKRPLRAGTTRSTCKIRDITSRPVLIRALPRGVCFPLFTVLFLLGPSHTTRGDSCLASARAYVCECVFSEVWNDLHNPTLD